MGRKRTSKKVMFAYSSTIYLRENFSKNNSGYTEENIGNRRRW